MSPALQIASVLALVAAFVGGIAGLRSFGQRRAWHAEVQRKIVHVAAGGLAMALPWLLPNQWQVWLLLGLTTLAMLGLRSRSLAGIGAAVHGVARASWGDLTMLAAIAMLFVLHQDQPILYVLPLAILTLADAAAALAGLRYGRIFYTTEDGQKSIEGSAILFLVALIIAMVCLLLLTDVPRPAVIAIGLAIAAFATVLEADSWQGFDNLFLPMGVYLLLFTTLEASASEAALRVALLLAAAAAMFFASRGVGHGGHVARVHALAVFLLLTVVSPANAVLPAVLFLAPALFATGPVPPRQTLGTVASLALVAFGFLAIGPATGFTAINFFALAAAGLTLATLIRSASQLVIVLAGPVLWGLWRGVVALNPPPADWPGPMGAAAALALVVSFAGAWWTRRSDPRLAALAGLGPATLLYFVYAVLQ
ncbi:MAG: hypothetical protein AAF914_13120 [Pseudomonadota bacterium]